MANRNKSKSLSRRTCLKKVELKFDLLAKAEQAHHFAHMEEKPPMPAPKVEQVAHFSSLTLPRVETTQLLWSETGFVNIMRRHAMSSQSIILALHLLYHMILVTVGRV